MKHSVYQNLMLMLLWLFLVMEALVLPSFMELFGNSWRAAGLWGLALLTVMWLWVTAYDAGVAFGWVP